MVGVLVIGVVVVVVPVGVEVAVVPVAFDRKQPIGGPCRLRVVAERVLGTLPLIASLPSPMDLPGVL